jgi:DNA-binding transcriptional MerR regulator
MLTVKQLSRLAGVTPRTLRFYDQIGLLKPTQVGENGYRYYDEQAIFRLQQILLYRELDLPLENIGSILSGKNFDTLQALKHHRENLHRRVEQMEKLIRTVDNTILYIEGKMDMKTPEFFQGFSDEQQTVYEQEAMQMYDPEVVRKSNQKWKSYTPADKKQIADEGNAIYRDLVAAMPKGPGSPEAQACVERWHQHMNYFWTPELDQLSGLAELYREDPRFKANFDRVDPHLAEFMLQAVQIYVQNHS